MVSRSTARSLCAALVLTTAAAPTGDARAGQGELSVSVGANVLIPVVDLGGEDGATITRVGVLGHVEAIYALTDFWQLGGILRGGAGLAGDLPVEGFAHAMVDVRFVIDALTWVPWLTFGVGALLRSDGPDAYAGTGEGPAVDMTVHVGLGVDYRPRREWSVGAAIRYQLVVTDFDRTTGPVDITVVGSFYFD